MSSARANAHASGSNLRPNVSGVASGTGEASGLSTPQNAQSQKTDIYRPIAAAIQRPLAPLLSPQTGPPPSAASLFDLDPATYSSRLANKNILLESTAAALSQPSALLHGKKLHKGHPEVRKRIREEAKQKRKERERDGVEGVRKVRKRLRDGQGVMQAGMKITYTSLIPLNHLHLTYLTHLLALPPLPTSLPSSSALPSGTSPEGLQSRLSKADLTGLHITVDSSRSPSLIGISGTIIEETSSTFRLVCLDDKLRVIPKSGTMFEVLIPAYAPPGFEAASGGLYTADGERPDPIDWEAHLSVCPRIRFLLLGTAFGFRSGERAGRKFRPAQGGGGGSGWGEEWVKGEWAGVLGAVEQDIQARAGGRSKSEEKVGKKGKRKRGSARRKDPPAWGRLEVP